MNSVPESPSLARARQLLKRSAERLDFLVDETFRLEGDDLQRLARAVASDTVRDLGEAFTMLRTNGEPEGTDHV